MKKLLLIALLITPSAFANPLKEAFETIKSIESQLDSVKGQICNEFNGEKKKVCTEMLTLAFKQAENNGRMKEIIGIK